MIINLKACVHGNTIRSEYTTATMWLLEGLSRLRNGCLLPNVKENWGDSSVDVTCGLEMNEKS